MRLMRFSYIREHTAGKSNALFDALSRSRALLSPSDFALVEKVELFVKEKWLLSTLAQRIETLNCLQCSDKVLLQVKQSVKTLWPTYHTAKDTLLRPCFESRSRISMVDGLVVFDDRIIIPQEEGLQVLRIFHQGHSGVTECRDHARPCVW